MAHRTHYPLNTVKSEAVLVTFRLVGAGAANMTIPTTGTNESIEVVSCTRTDTGDFDVVLRHKYPELRSVVGANFGPRATAGLRAAVVAHNLPAGTLSITCEVGAVPTDPATGDTLHVTLLVRNSGRNA